MAFATMAKPRPSTTSREPIALPVLLEKLANIERDLIDIAGELRTLNDSHYLPVAIQPSITQCQRQSAFAADHAGTALLVLRSKQQEAGQ